MAPASAYQMLTAARLPLDPTTQVGIRRETKRSRISQPRKLDGVAGGHRQAGGRAVRHHLGGTRGRGELAPSVDGRKAMACRQRHDLIAPGAEEWGDRGPSGSHLPSFRHHYRLLGHPFHQRDFMKWALLDHGQCCCIKLLPPFVTSGLI